MDSEIKDALLKLIETGTEIAPHVVHDLLFWAKILPLLFIPILILLTAAFLYCIPKAEKTEKINPHDVVCIISAPFILISLLGFILSFSSAIQAHFTPYAYLINLIK